MSIFEVIKGDHEDIRVLLNEVIDQTSVSIPKRKHELEHPEDWEEALHDLKLALVAHNRAEEATLYLKLRSLSVPTANTKIHEHNEAEDILHEIERMNPQDREWGERLGFLRNQIESHQAEEETSTFDLIKPLIEEEESSRLAEEFVRLRDDLVEGAKYHPKGRSVVNPAGLNLDG